MRTLLPPPPTSSPDYSPDLASLAARILYPNPLPSTASNLPLYILSATALPSARSTSYDNLLPYILARLPSNDDLLAGLQYEIIFFAHPNEDKKKLPGWQWLVHTYGLLSRVLRKRLKKLWVVGAERWIRVLVEGVMTVVGTVKGRRKVGFIREVEGLEAVGVCVGEVCVPVAVWIAEQRKRRKRVDDDPGEGRSSRRAFGVRKPLPWRAGEGTVRLPRVLRETTSFLLMDECVKTEGLFRVNAKAVMVEALREMYERGQQFVIWKERNTALCFPCWKEGMGNVSVEELEDKEGFDVHAAAGLIKMWYGDLREPLFPQTCYQALEKFYGGAEVHLEPEQLVGMLKEDAEWTILTPTARKILRMHLLPFLSRIINFGEWNRMTASSLAVCFAPALLKGPDIEEDLRVMVTVRKLLEAMISNWQKDLAPVFQSDHGPFEDQLRLPEAIADREDPLEEGDEGFSSREAQMSGIMLVDNDDSASEDAEHEVDDIHFDEPPPLPIRSAAVSHSEDGLPPLPPRPRTSSAPEDAGPPLPPRLRSCTVADIPATSPTSSPSPSPTNSSDNKVKRKPAPTVQPLPRYSMVVGSSSHQTATLEHIPFYNTVEQPVEVPENLEADSGLPRYDSLCRTTIPRKPVPKLGPKREE
ncbi:MAG: hypothetical protein LQ346_000691 [Caloplaca aetnensis]|nr:MAG: hypothetical protein LQ346_000691 [Caloplaca aetnensis]